VRAVVRGDPSPRYRIYWDDGHESVLTPAAGCLHCGAPATRVHRRRSGLLRESSRTLREDVEPEVREALYGGRSGAVERLSGV
jgi:hypothetical protein